MKLGVAGAGTMGRGIAQTAAQAGSEVVLYDLSQETVEQALVDITQRLLRLEEKGKLGRGESAEISGRIKLASDFSEFKDCGFIAEAVAEDLGVKQEVFIKLEQTVSQRAVLATNTSSISIDRIASGLAHPQRVIGMHYFNPVPVMKLVEVIRGAKTSEATVEAARDLARRLGKTTVDAKDAPGFIVNRILRPFFLQPLYMIEKGEADVETIDQALRDQGYPMGPLQLGDFNGLDVNLTITKVIYEELGRPDRLRPSPVQETLVREGDWGRKSGKGYYSYQGQQAVGVNPRLSAFFFKPDAPRLKPKEIALKIIKAQIFEADLLVKGAVATAHHIDLAMRLGTNAPRGPFEWKEELREQAKI